MKKRREWTGIFAMIIICAAILYVPPMFSGHVIQGQIPNIQGRWNVTNTVSLSSQSSSNCEIRQPTFSYLMDVYQTGDKYEATALPFVFYPSLEAPTVSNFDMKGEFLSQSHLSGDISYTLPGSHGGTLTGHVTEFVLSSDCNSATSQTDWTFKGDTTCFGTSESTSVRLDNLGCGYKCISNFTCSDFGECINGTQTRLCFDNNQCNKTQSSKTETQSCQMPAPVPEHGSNIIVYIILILILLIIAAAAVLYFMKSKKQKSEFKAVEALRMMLQSIDKSLYFGEKQRAMEQYKAFSEGFSRYSGEMSDEDRQSLYQEGMMRYQKMSQN